MNLTGQRVVVMGLGLHGGAIGTVEWLHTQGAQVLVTDLRSAADLEPTLTQLKDLKDITFVLGEHRESDFLEADMIVRNPAVPRSSSFLQKAKEAGIPIEMDSSLFFKYCPSKHIIGITGSKGKTTTTTAIYILMKAARSDVVLVGVEGTSPLGELHRITADTIVVFELSSWRLEALEEHCLSPAIAVTTSLYRDHLNTYASYEEYIEMKKVIMKYQDSGDQVLLNADDALLRKWEPEVKGKLVWYSSRKLPAGANGIVIENGEVNVHHDGQITTLCAQTDLPLSSEHEQRNLLPALFLSQQTGASPEILKEALAHVKALPHRLEVVRERNNVTYVNDSAATMPDATIAALKSMGNKPVVLILGGNDKALLFKELGEAVNQATIRALVWLPGTVTATMKEYIAAPTQQDAASMREAVEKAAHVARSGDTVLLSPGATSFALFQNEFDRGNQFRSAVLALH